MKISVIICSYKGNEGLARSCISSLEQQNSRPYEVIIVVDSPEEKQEFSNQISFSKLFPMKIIASGKKGLAAARNYGVYASSGEIIAFIDDDAIADPMWLAEIEKSFSKANEIIVVGGSVQPVFDGKRIDKKWNWIIGCTSQDPPSRRPIGCNISFKLKVFKEFGGFDENLGRIQKRLSIGEETELILRIEGYINRANIVCNRDAIVYHRVPRERTTIRYMLRRSYREGFGKAIIGKTYFLGTEKSYLTYYFTHPDWYTVPVLCAVFIGYIRGKLMK